MMFWNRHSQLIMGVLTVAAFALPTLATASSTIVGHGNSKCSLYNDAAKSTNELRSGFETWAVGYLSGINAITNIVLKDKDFLVRPSGEEIISYLQNYCQANPSKTWANAVNEYWLQNREK
jgi:hypothetical protein